MCWNMLTTLGKNILSKWKAQSNTTLTPSVSRHLSKENESLPTSHVLYAIHEPLCPPYRSRIDRRLLPFFFPFFLGKPRPLLDLNWCCLHLPRVLPRQSSPSVLRTTIF